nr:inositol 1,4,5-trisphosphate binding protein [rats, brain, Peptide Partial, 13 aa] [Rattus sp.]
IIHHSGSMDQRQK